jgi:uncharacterized Zn-binding protein involved in type VI secretion
MGELRPVSRLGDSGSHGGEPSGKIVTGSPDVTVNGRPIARVSDTYDCAFHGPNLIVKGSTRLTANNLPVVRVGDITACGAVIIQGSEDTFDGG